jgi:hypothetical protein
MRPGDVNRKPSNFCGTAAYDQLVTPRAKRGAAAWRRWRPGTYASSSTRVVILDGGVGLLIASQPPELDRAPLAEPYSERSRRGVSGHFGGVEAWRRSRVDRTEIPTDPAIFIRWAQ